MHCQINSKVEANPVKTDSIPVTELKRLTPDLSQELALFFETINNDPYFHPHPLTPAHANTICNYRGRDLYVAAVQREMICGYGMLRGWDEGFDVPSLGIIIAPEFRGFGLGKLLMTYMHYLARLRNASSIRLKVYPENSEAIALYRKLGYRFEQETDNGQLVGRLLL